MVALLVARFRIEPFRGDVRPQTEFAVFEKDVFFTEHRRFATAPNRIVIKPFDVVQLILIELVAQIGVELPAVAQRTRRFVLSESGIQRYKQNRGEKGKNTMVHD